MHVEGSQAIFIPHRHIRHIINKVLGIVISCIDEMSLHRFSEALDVEHRDEPSHFTHLGCGRWPSPRLRPSSQRFAPLTAESHGYGKDPDEAHLIDLSNEAHLDLKRRGLLYRDPESVEHLSAKEEQLKGALCTVAKQGLEAHGFELVDFDFAKAIDEYEEFAFQWSA